MTQPFYFPDGRVANNTEDLLELCEQYPDDATGFLVRQDLEKWLADIGSYDIAECAVYARQIDASDRLKLTDFLNKCHSLSSPKPVSLAETEIALEDNLTSQPSPFFVPQPSEAESSEAESSEVELASQEPEQQSTPPTPLQSELPLPPVAQPIPLQKPASSSTVFSTSGNTVKSQEKPSFFQVVAKVIVKIFYSN